MVMVMVMTRTAGMPLTEATAPLAETLQQKVVETLLPLVVARRLETPRQLVGPMRLPILLLRLQRFAPEVPRQRLAPQPLAPQQP